MPLASGGIKSKWIMVSIAADVECERTWAAKHTFIFSLWEDLCDAWSIWGQVGSGSVNPDPRGAKPSFKKNLNEVYP